MTNKSLIFYGKPQSFERYEITERRDIIIDTNNEPRLKLPRNDKDILHYFFKGDNYYLELYGYANPHNDVRQGVVIGVCIKSDKPIAISYKNVSKLQLLLDHFKEIALQDTQFKKIELNLINDFKQTIENHDKINKALSNFNDGNLQKQIHKGLTLLCLPDFVNSIDSVKDEIGNYSDIYISADKNVFEDDLNTVIFNEVKKKYCIVENGKIIEYQELQQKQNGFYNGNEKEGETKSRQSGELEPEIERKKRKKLKRQTFIKSQFRDNAVLWIAFILFAAFVVYEKCPSSNRRFAQTASPNSAIAGQQVQSVLENGVPDNAKNGSAAVQSDTKAVNIYEVKSGDTFGKIANSYSITKERLKELNPDVVNPEHIEPGQKLKVPER